MSEEATMRIQILDAAGQQFAARGFEATPLSAIAAQVGIQKPSLLYHFSSKDELRRAVLARLMGHWSEVLPQILQAATTGGRRFRALAEAIVAFFTEDPSRARLLLREMLDRPQQLRELMREHVAPWLAVLADYIRLGQQEGRIWPGLDPEAYLFHIIHHLISGVAVTPVFVPMYDEATALDAVELRTRHTTELVRIAHDSLFMPRQRPATPKPDEERS